MHGRYEIQESFGAGKLLTITNMQISLGANIIHVSDVVRERDWFERIFGMETLEYEPENRFAKMRLGSAIFYIESPNPNLSVGFREGRVGVRSSIIFLTDDIKGFMDKAALYGARIMVPATKQFYGGIDGVIADADGNEFTIHSREKDFV